MEDHHHKSLIRNPADCGSKPNYDINPGPARASESNPMSWDADKHATLRSNVSVMVCIIIGRMRLQHCFRHLPAHFLSTPLPVSRFHRYILTYQENMDLASEGSATRRFIRSLEVPPPKGNTYAITQWVNADLAPMDSSRRTWNGWKYVVYWATGGKLFFPRNCLTAPTNHSYLHRMYLGFAIYNYNTGSALIAYGLSAKQALAAGILSPIVLVTMCILCGVSFGRGQLLQMTLVFPDDPSY